MLFDKQFLEIVSYVNNLSNGEKILVLAKDPEYFHTKGQHVGKPNQNKIAEELDCSDSTVRYHLDPDNSKKRKEQFKKQKEKKKTIGYIYGGKYRRHTKDPESIYKGDSFRKIFSEEIEEEIV